MIDQKTANDIFKTKMKNRQKGDDGNDYELISDYKKSNQKVKFLHKKCNRTFFMRPNRFLCGDNCPECRKEKLSKLFTKDSNWFKDKILQLEPSGDYELLDEYINTHTKVKILHHKCGNVLEMTPNSFITGVRCKYCSGNYKRDNTILMNELLKIDPKYSEYEILSEYVRNNDNLLILHKKCGKTFYRSACTFKICNKCPRCESPSKIPYYEDLVERFESQEKSKDYELLTTKSEFKNMTQKLKIRHKECNKVFMMTIYHYTDGNCCPFCSALKKNSLSSQILEKYFIDNNIKYEKEKQFETCKLKRHLSFDYYLPEYNTVIEYDGQQHFQIKFSEESFKHGRICDTFKNEWCKNNNINLIRISYKMKPDEIEDLLFILFLEDKSSTTISKESTIIDDYWKQVTPYYCYIEGDDIVYQ